MPNPSTQEPNFAPTVPGTPAAALRRILHTLLGFLALCVLVILAWAPVAALALDVQVERFGGVARFRLLGAALFGTLLLARFLIRPPKQPPRRVVVWRAFAGATGGTVSSRGRLAELCGWARGISVCWDRDGTEVRLGTSTDTNRDEYTQFTATLRLRNGFQFHLVRKDAITKAFFSAQLWDLAVAAVKDGARSKGGVPDSAGVADRLAFMAAKEILIGYPKFDDAFLLKSDTPRLARELLGDAAVAYCVHEVDRHCRGWQLSLMSRDGVSAHQLTLAVPGAMLDPGGLEAGWKLMEASIRRVADRGMLASGDLERSTSRPVGGPAAAA
jgi:hypothetical protein